MGAIGNAGMILIAESANIADGAVQPAKLSTGGPSWDTNGNMTLQGELVGTNTNDSAASGYVGEYLESTSVTAASPTSLVNSTAKTITSLSLTAGDWDVWAQGGNGGMNTTSIFVIGLSLTNNALPADEETYYIRTDSAGRLIGICGGQIPQKRISVASTTTVYLVAHATFASGTSSAYGKIMARRVR